MSSALTQHDPRSPHRIGERRRRREAQREAERLAEQTGQIPLPSRRELRRRALEEAARQQALATGEIQLGADGEVIVKENAESPEPVTRRSMRAQLEADSSEARHSSARTATGMRPVVRTPATARAVRGLDETGALSAIQPLTPASPQTGEVTVGLHATLDDSAVALPAFNDTEPATDVVLPGLPAAASAQRHDTAAPAAQAQAHEDIDSTENSDLGNDLDEAADVEDDSDGEGDSSTATKPLQPRWRGLATATGAGRVARRSLRHAPGGAAASGGPIATAAQAMDTAGSAPLPPERDRGDEAEPAPHNPALFVVKIIILALVGVILGGLVWLLASDAFAATTASGFQPGEAADGAWIFHYDQLTAPGVEECCAP